MAKELSLYVHIPFCESKCYYCNFVSKKATLKEKRNYVNFLLREIELNQNKDYIIKTIFIGGGTPSCLDAQCIEKILLKIKENFVLDENCEITIEANPNSFDKNKATRYKQIGINRISFGLQSASNKLLKKINRIHTKDDFVNSVKIAKEIGFNNINADILVGLPYQRMFHVKSTLRLLKKLDIVHISCYSLILEENTPLYLMIKNKKFCLPSEEKTLKMFDYCNKFLTKNKIYRYEVSNFAKVGYECKHNLVYWNLDDYLGLGLNSHSKIGESRFENFSDFESYYLSLRNNKKPIKSIQKLSLSEQKEEFIMLGLRKTSGINLDEFKAKFNEDLKICKAKEIEFFEKNSFIKLENNFLKATDLGFKVLNQIILDLCD